ncbi:MAG TPA: FHA domain-containing protein [Chromatiales bacterium]|nr:FHA domain-containing protein [Chromatiales bacterium]
MNTERNDPKIGRAGPQGTTLFQAGELAEIIASPSADTEGDIERAALEGITPPFLDQRFVLKRGKTMVGRRDDNDIILPDGSVSAQHAWILHENGQYRVMNMLSTNGIFINGEKVHEAPLHEGDRIRFGRAEFVFRSGALSGLQEDRSRVPLWVWAGAVLVLALIAVAFALT